MKDRRSFFGRMTMYRFFLIALMFSGQVLAGSSFYSARLEDPQAVYFSQGAFPVHADGVEDDAPALQAAIDQVGADRRAGILFIPEGRYRLGKTVYVWPGVRLIGFGAHRPVFLLGANTPGFQEGEDKYLIYFSGGRGRDGAPRDGSPGTFYSAMSNIDIEIGPGNPAAVGVRFHVAQHCYLSHMDFRLGDAKAGLQDIGNEIEDLHFTGGQYGIITRRSAPGWPILAIGAAGARNAGIFAVQMLATADAALADKLVLFKEEMAAGVIKKSARLQEKLRADGLI